MTSQWSLRAVLISVATSPGIVLVVSEYVPKQDTARFVLSTLGTRLWVRQSASNLSGTLKSRRASREASHDSQWVYFRPTAGKQHPVFVYRGAEVHGRATAIPAREEELAGDWLGGVASPLPVWESLSLDWLAWLRWRGGWAQTATAKCSEFVPNVGSLAR